MAIYKHTYKNYSGTRTETWSRFLILTRFGLARVYQSNFLLLFIIACLFYPLACAAYIYLSHNAPFLAALNIPARMLPQIDGRFFYFYSIVQGALAYLLTAFVGPVWFRRILPTAPCRFISAVPFRAPNTWRGR